MTKPKRRKPKPQRIDVMQGEAKAMEQKANCCKLCGAPFTNINGMSSTNCNCARERSTELAEAQKKWDESKRSTSMQGEAKEEGWIANALPPIGESVLLTTTWGNVILWQRSGNEPCANTLAWRPLPPPYVPPKPKPSAEEQLAKLREWLRSEFNDSDCRSKDASRVLQTMDAIAAGEDVG